MSLVQLLVEKDSKAAALKALLDREGFEVVRASAPNFARKGAIVADRRALEQFPALLDYPDRVIPIASNDQKFLGMLWQHRIRSVVFDNDPPGTVLLAILASEIGNGISPRAPRGNLIVLGSR
jgi:hypothetical protein